MAQYLKLIKNCILPILCFVTQTLFSQSNILSASTIPTELRTNANAVIRKSIKTITIEAIDKMHIKQMQIVTVLNAQGNDVLDTYLRYDDDVKINHLSFEIFDGFGKKIKSFSKSKFIDASAVESVTMYSDDRVKYIDYTPTTYPYTAIFESEYKTASTGFIPTWYPIESYGVAVQHSEYLIYNPNDIDIKVKEKHFKNYPIKNVSSKKIHYLMENQPAIHYENLSPSLIDSMPSLLVALNNFTLKGVKGNAHNWKVFGKWMNEKLLSDKIMLNEGTINKAKALVKGVNNDIEKAKILYQYMQDKTRYISVQIGIGGWEPMPAKEVDKVGYGDCKGLTNYTKALFDAVGITSNYTLVYAGNRRDIDSSFSSLQGNHAILNLPNNGNDIWLECTSQTLPFGFLGDFTDNRNVLVISPEGGIVKRTPSYKDETNSQITKAIIALDPKGNATAQIEKISKGIQYDNTYYIEKYSEKDLKEYYKTKAFNYINNLDIENIQIDNDKDGITFKEKLTASIKEYAILNQGEYIFKVNIFNRNTYIPKRYRTRKSSFKVGRGYKDVDEFIFKIPDGYFLDPVPQKKELKSKFGHYSVTLEKIDNKTLRFTRTILIKSGTYPKEDYKLYRTFRRDIAKYENSKIILKQTEE